MPDEHHEADTKIYLAIREETVGKNGLWGAMLGGLLMIVLGLSGAASPAQAATSNLKVSADPTEEKAATVTITGQAEESQYLWVVVFPEVDHGCDSSTVDDFAYGDHDATPLLRFDPLQAGSYQRTANFTLSEPGLYRVCSFVSKGRWDTPNVKASKSFSVRAATATTKLAVSSDPTMERQVTVTITGETEVSRYLWVVVFPEADHGCNSSTVDQFAYGDHDALPLLRFEPLAAGSYQRTADFTLSEPGPYRVCSFVSQGRWDTPNAKASKSFSVRGPNATSEIQVSPDPVVDNPVTVSVSGQVEIDRYLWVVAYPEETQECDTYRPTDGVFGGWDGEHVMQAEWIRAGHYQESATFIPPFAGSFRVCSYVSGSSFGKLNAKASKTFGVRKAKVQMSVVPEGPFEHMSESLFAINGVTEAAGYLTSYSYPDTRACPARPGAGLKVGSYEYPVEVGSFETHWVGAPTAPGVNRICVYLTDFDDEIVGVASVDVSVKRNPAFLPKLITPNGKLGFGGPPTLKWKAGPGRDFVEIFRSKPRASSQPMRFDTRSMYFSGSFASGRWSLSFRRSFEWPYGRFWWRIARKTTASGYVERSRPRYVISAPRRR